MKTFRIICDAREVQGSQSWLVKAKDADEALQK